MAWTKVCEKSEIPVGSIKKVWARIGGGIPIAVAHHKNGYVAIPPVAVEVVNDPATYMEARQCLDTKRFPDPKQISNPSYSPTDSGGGRS